MGPWHLSTTCTRAHTRMHTCTHSYSTDPSAPAKPVQTWCSLVGKPISTLAPFSAQDPHVQAAPGSRSRDDQAAQGLWRQVAEKCTEPGVPRKEAKVSRLPPPVPVLSFSPNPLLPPLPKTRTRWNCKWIVSLWTGQTVWDGAGSGRREESRCPSPERPRAGCFPTAPRGQLGAPRENCRAWRAPCSVLGSAGIGDRGEWSLLSSNRER